MKRVYLALFVLTVCLEAANAGNTMPGTQGYDLSRQSDQQQYKHKYQLTLNKPLAFGKINCVSRKIPVGNKFELSFPLDAVYTNPFDPDEIKVDAQITCPDGQKINHPIFFFSEFKYDTNKKQWAKTRGASGWKLRFSPSQTGMYKVTLTAKDKSGEKSVNAGNFVAVGSNWPGRIRVSRQNLFALEFANGKAYYPLGPNIPLWGATVKEYARHNLGLLLDRMQMVAAAGGNYTRLRADSYFQAIELPLLPKSGFLGHGWYNQARCYEIDRIFAAAEKLGIRLQYCIYNSNIITGQHATRDWARPFCLTLKENGGPCDDAKGFWKSEKMRQLTQKRLRYIVARWGYSSALLAWEFFNETELCSTESLAWHKRMSEFLRKLDPYKHLITTSTHKVNRENARAWNLKDIDIVQTHLYGGIHNNVLAIKELIANEHGYVSKPYLLGEWGIAAGKENNDYQMKDPEGVSMHNAIWSMAMNGGCGISSWYIANLEKYNLYNHYKTFSNWGHDVPWNQPRKKLRISNIMLSGAQKRYSDTAFTGVNPDKFSKSPKTIFTVSSEDGKVSDLQYLQNCLHAQAGRKTTPEFILDCVRKTSFSVITGTSIGDAANALKIYIDDKLAKTQPLPAKGKKNKYGNSTTRYNPPAVTSVNIPSGKHKVKVEAVGRDRLDNVSYMLKSYAARPMVGFYGFTVGKNAYIWVHNSMSSIVSTINNSKTVPVKDLTVTLDGADGTYNVESYDCWSGQTKTIRANCKDGKMKIKVPVFNRDIALKILRTAE